MKTTLTIILGFDVDHGNDDFTVKAEVEVVYDMDRNTGVIEATNANVRRINNGVNPEWLTPQMILSFEDIAIFTFNQNPEKYS